jgi:hypothetical protein
LDSPAAACCFVSFSQKNVQRTFFCEKDLISSALPEALSPAKRGIV